MRFASGAAWPPLKITDVLRDAEAFRGLAGAARCATPVSGPVGPGASTWLHSFLDLGGPRTEPGSVRMQRALAILNLAYGVAAILVLVIVLIALGRTN
jgi:hypothetical protein